MRSLIVLVLLCLLPVAPAQTGKGDKSPIGKAKALSAIPGYKKQLIHGFTLLVNDDVYKNNDDKKWRRKPLDVLELELGTIVRRLPDRAVKALQKLLVWVEWYDESDPDIGKAVAKYYGASGNLRAWSLSKGKHPLKANNIEIINMMSLTREHQPGVKLERCVILHEMAHAVHHRDVGFNNPTVRTAYKQAMDRGLYNEAKDVYGRTHRPPYAATNPAEYFAELSCAYLDKLHYFPFTPDDLKKHDPAGYKVMEQIWGTRKKIDTALKAKAEKQAAARLAAAQKDHAAGRKERAVSVLEWLIQEMPDTKAAATAKKLVEKWGMAEE